MAEPLALVTLSEEKCPWWQYIGIGQIRKAAARKPGRRPISARDFLAGHDDLLFENSRLRVDRLVSSKKNQTCACHKWNKPLRR